MNHKIREELIKLSEEKYKQFSQNLLPGIDNILGVRLPILRNIAKDIAKCDHHNYLLNANDLYFEEVMLQALVIGYINTKDINEVINYIEIFIPKINNWSVCDSFCNSLKITNKNKEVMLSYITPYLNSPNEYEVRFAVVMMLNYYIDKEYIDTVLNKLDDVTHDGYYAKMAVAWALSICYVNYEKETYDYLQNNNLSDFTYNKAIQKICESNRVSSKHKSIIKQMKRKSK